MFRKTFLSTLLVSVCSLSNAVTLRDNHVIIYYTHEIRSLNIDEVKPVNKEGKLVNPSSNYVVGKGQPFKLASGEDVDGYGILKLDVNIQAGRKSDIGVNKSLYGFFNYMLPYSTSASKVIDSVEYDVVTDSLRAHESSSLFPNFIDANFAIKTSLDLGSGIKIPDIIFTQHHYSDYSGHNLWTISNLNMSSDIINSPNFNEAVTTNHCLLLQATDDSKYTLCGINNSANQFYLTKGWTKGSKNTSVYHHKHVYFTADDGVTSINFVPSKDVEGQDNSASHYITQGQAYLANYVTAAQDKRSFDINTIAGLTNSVDVKNQLSKYVPLSQMLEYDSFNSLSYYFSGTLFINGEKVTQPIYLAIESRPFKDIIPRIMLPQPDNLSVYPTVKTVTNKSYQLIRFTDNTIHVRKK